MAATRIPLFPLEVVLFPDELLPLHIFEPRYKEMIRDCNEKKQSFGVVLAAEEGLAEVACTAEILEIAKTYDNGEMDVVTVGRRVCRILEVVEERSYYEAEVEFLEEGPPPKQVPSTALLQLYEKCHRVAFEQGPDRGALAKEEEASGAASAGSGPTRGTSPPRSSSSRAGSGVHGWRAWPARPSRSAPPSIR